MTSTSRLTKEHDIISVFNKILPNKIKNIINRLAYENTINFLFKTESNKMQFGGFAKYSVATYMYTITHHSWFLKSGKKPVWKDPSL